MQSILLYTTFPDLQAAETVIHTLLAERLIACANVLPEMQAIYRWQGKVTREAEVAVWLKTTSQSQQPLMTRLKALHPYDTPCILIISPNDVDMDYMAWLARETD